MAGGEIVSTLDGFSSPRPILLVTGGDFQNTLAAADGTTGTYSGVISGDSPLQIDGGNIPDVTGKADHPRTVFDADQHVGGSKRYHHDL